MSKNTKEVKASDLIKSPIIIDQQAIIYKLRNMRYAQTEVFEDSINNYVLLSQKLQPISKYSLSQDNNIKGDIIKRAATINEDADVYPIDNSSVAEPQKIAENVIANNEMRLMELQGKQLALSSTIRQLENVIKDLTEETNQKSLLFTEQLRNNLNANDSSSNNNNLLNTRFALPRTVLQYSILRSKGRQLLAWLEKEDNGMIFLRFFNLTTQKTIPQAIPGNFSHFSAFEDTVLLAEEGKEVEVWRMNSNSSSSRNEGTDSLTGSFVNSKNRKVSLDINTNRKASGDDSKLSSNQKRKMSLESSDKLEEIQFTRLMTANAHNDGVIGSQLLSRNIFVTASRKGILKIWQALPSRLLSVHRFDAYPTAFSLLPHSIQLLAPLNSFLLAAGFANGVVRIVQFSQENTNTQGKVDNMSNSAEQSQQQQQQQCQLDEFENLNICEIKFEFALQDYYCNQSSASATNTANTANKNNNILPSPLSGPAPISSVMEIINSLQTAHCRAEGDWCNQVIISASVSTHPDNIYLISCLRKKAYSLQESGEHLYRNSSGSRQFGLTGEALFAGSFNGQVFTWDISQLSMVNLLTPVIKRINLAITYATVSVFYVQYDAVTDQLLSADQQGNVLVWNSYQSSIVRK